MLINLLSPLVMYGWLVILLLNGGYHWLKLRSKPARRDLIMFSTHVLIMINLWPPLWMLPTSSPRALSGHQPSVSIMTWNVQRLGELAKHHRRRDIQKRTQCATHAIQEIERSTGRDLEVFAFQEVSNRRLQRLQSLLSLQCQFISYHPTQRTVAAGLGLCVKAKGTWKINYVRKIKLDERGSWRALFAELSMRDDPSINLNLINLHFLPHGIKPQELRGVLTSPRTAWRLLKDIRDTSSSQQTQASRLLEVIEDYRDPTLLVGDFNAPPGVGAHPLLASDWVDVWAQVGRGLRSTRQFGGLIPLRVDYIYARRGVLSPHFAYIGGSELYQCSDHLPVISTVSLSQ